MSFFQKHISCNRYSVICTGIAVLFLMLFPFLPVRAQESVTSQEQSLIISKSITHKHTGNKNNGGGCYGKRCSKTETVEVPCGGTMVYYPATDTTGCDRCGAGYKGDQSGRKCWTTYEETRSSTYYEINCGESTSTEVGKLSVVKSTDEWTKKLTLNASYEVTKGMRVKENPYIWNGQESNNPVFEVTQNGQYTLQLNADANSDTEKATITVNVENIDVTPPKIGAYELSPQGWTKDGVTVSLTDVTDLQPSGTGGCGLGETPYSYDGGKTWCKEEKHLYRENGTYQICVRDCLNNESSIEVVIDSIDTTGPVIESVEYDHTRNIAATTLTITAKDVQKDGSEGCGLHEKAYSYDHGKTWNAKSVYPVKQSGSVAVAVRDKLGNVTYASENITNIDSTGPKVWHILVPDYWTNQPVTACFFAKDEQPDGSEGVGLAANCFSFDDGNTWQEEGEWVLTENGSVRVFVRDLFGNRTVYEIPINNIDKNAPSAKLSYVNNGNETEPQINLVAEGYDGESGLHKAPYSWDGGKTFTDKNTCPIQENGVYTVVIRDQAGNIASAETEIKLFANKKRIPIKTKTQDIPSEKKDTAKATVKKTTSKKIPILAAKEEPKQTEVISSNGKNGWRIALAVGILLCILLLLLALAVYYRMIIVYVRTQANTFTFRGVVWIRRREERYEAVFKESLLEKCSTTHFKFRPSYLFLWLHKGEDICFLFPDKKCVTMQAQKEMETVLL